MRGGRFTGTAPRFSPRNSGRTARPGPGPGGGASPFTPYVDATLGLTAAAHLNFVDRLYYWNGGEQGEGSFTTFAGVTFGTGAAAGFTGTGTASDYSVTLPWALLNITTPFVMVAVFRPTNVNGTSQHIINLGAPTPSQNRATIDITTWNVGRVFTNVGNVKQSSHSSGVLNNNTVYAIAGLIQTNLFRASMNGATMDAEDTSGAVAAYDTVTLLESVSGASPFIGAVRHVLFFQNIGGAEISQADLNTLSGNLAEI